MQNLTNPDRPPARGDLMRNAFGTVGLFVGAVASDKQVIYYPHTAQTTFNEMCLVFDVSVPPPQGTYPPSERLDCLERIVFLLAESLGRTPLGLAARATVRKYMPKAMLPWENGDRAPEGYGDGDVVI